MKDQAKRFVNIDLWAKMKRFFSHFYNVYLEHRFLSMNLMATANEIINDYAHFPDKM